MKRHLLDDVNDTPLSLTVSGAKRHDSVSLDSLPKNWVVAPRQEDASQNLCLDPADVGNEDAVLSNGFIPNIRPRGEEMKLLEKNLSFKV